MLILKPYKLISHSFTKISLTQCRCKYEQGQYVGKGVREYFYYIDHQGQLFLDDAKIKNFTSCFKEKDFLKFFFKRIKKNQTGKYENQFPFVSPCGREKNYIRFVYFLFI